MISIPSSLSRSRRGLLVSLLGVLVCTSAFAFPPAPPHTLFGMLRDEFGAAISSTEARVLFVSESGLQIETRVIPNLATGVNYEILVPMDAGIAPDLYRPDAMQPTVPFRLKVLINGQTYLPIEMSGSLIGLGEPSGNTRLDLTLGLDSDEDGIPDAWKDLVISMMGGGLTRADITPGGDVDNDGFSNLNEYIAGTYAWDDADYLGLEIIQIVEGRAVLEFVAISGRTYSIEACNDLNQWREVAFRLESLDSPGTRRTAYLSPDLRVLRIEADADTEFSTLYRLRVR
jgi:hypothetical protein